MTTYSLTVQIDDVVLRQRSSDKLAIARKVNGSLSAVFDAHRQGSSIQFEWSDKYRVFLAYGDRNGVRVREPLFFLSLEGISTKRAITVLG